MSAEFGKTGLENITEKQKVFLAGFINLNQHGLVINWDLDQTLEISEEPVKAFTDAEFGTNYFERRVDGWNSISDWLLEDKVLNEKGEILTKEEAKDFERNIWINNDILMMGPPNKNLRRMSFVAGLRGIEQYVTTVRVCGLRQTTYRWLDEYFRWIPKGNINHKIGMAPSGFEYKIGTILDLYKERPGLVHVDDDIKIIKELAKAAPGMGIIGIITPSDDLSAIKYADNRVFLSRDVLNSLIYYGPFAEDMLASEKE